MSRRKAGRRTPRKKPPVAPGHEWLGGRVSPPFFVTEGEDGPFRVEMVIWMELPGGLIVAQEAIAPGESRGALGRALLAAMQQPLGGAARRPASIRVANPSLAAEARVAVGGAIPIEVAPTPELDEFLELMIEWMSGGDEEGSYFEGGRVSAEALGELFAAAELLYRVAPWEVASDAQVLRLDIPELDVEGACVSIIGALRESMGLLIFPSLAGYDAFGEAAEKSPNEGGGMDLGTDWLALSFERGADLPAAMRREIATHGWPVADAHAYPRVEQRERDGASRPLTERDVRIVSACAASLTAFFAEHRDIFEADEIEEEPVCESFTDERGLTVRFTLPYEALPLFDVDDAPAHRNAPPRSSVRGPKVGRNAPCPCGSGKKYKKCHLKADQARETIESGASALHELDNQLVLDMSLFAGERFGEQWRRMEKAFIDPVAALDLAIPWSVYHFRVEGRPVFEWYLEERARRLSADERQWLSAQRDAWLSMWEVIEVQPGESLTLQDHLSGEVRFVHEIRGSETLVKRDTILVRVVEHGGVAVLCGLHPRALPPTEAAEVVRRARSRLRRKSAVPVERLQDEKLGRYLIARWEEAVEELYLRRKAPLQLQNTDGEALLLTTDHFELRPAARSEVKARLAALEGVELPEPDAEEPRYVFLRSGKAPHRSRGDTVVGAAWLSDRALHLETNSRERAEALRRRVEEACGELIRHRAREHADLLSRVLQPGEPDSPESATPPEAQQLVLDFKEQHYAGWLDEPVPALGGKSPREAAQTAAGRAEIDVLLKDMENHEQRLPEAARFDFSRLRAALAIDP